MPASPESLMNKTPSTPSLKNQTWIFDSVDERQVLYYSQKFDLPLLIAEILVRRKIEEDQVDDFLKPSIKQMMPDPYTLKDMQQAVEVLYQSLENHDKIVVYGDYDVDGATSSALLKRFFNHLNIPAKVYIPDRLSEGYGPNLKAFETFKRDGVGLIITVDCGTLSYDPLAFAHREGIKVIVLDHHKADVKLPEASALINPNRLDEDQDDLRYCAAVGVSFLFLVAMNRFLREMRYYGINKIQEPDLISYLDLVALGTVCDVVPLTGLNRAYVAQGLKIMARRHNTGLRALMDVAQLNEPPSTYHLGFVLGPRINAGGRVGESYLGSTLLSLMDEDEVQATSLSQKLNIYNEERKTIELNVLEQAIEKVEREKLDKNPILLVEGRDWHPGVIGIVASRLKDKYYLPTCVLGIDQKDIAKASGRSITGLDLGACILAANQAGYLMNGGGHAMAVGFTCEYQKLPDLYNFLNERVSLQFPNGMPQRSYRIDGAISLGGLTLELAEMIETLGPFGTSHPEPRFMLTQVKILSVEVVKDEHLRCLLQGAGGEKESRSTLMTMCFKSVGTDLGNWLIKRQKERPVMLVGQIKINNFRGQKSVQFLIDDGADY